MRARCWKLVLILTFSLSLLYCDESRAQAPTITALSPTAGAVGSGVTITGTGFGATQGTGTVSLNGTAATIASWSNTTIVAIVPSGASSGLFSVTVSSHAVNSTAFTVTNLPTGWLDGDIGQVGLAGSATYTNGTFTVTGAGSGDNGPPDAFNLAYQPLSGDGSIVARVVSLQGGSNPQAGVMIRESLDPAATNVYSYLFRPTNLEVADRTSTGAAASNLFFLSVTVPYWVKAVRSGSTFAEYSSPDGVNWTQLGTSQTITMVQNVYIGLGVASFSTSVLSTATFDNVSVTSPSIPGPIINYLSGTTASIGSQVLISGTGFGASEGSSVVMLNGLPMPVNVWEDSLINITIPPGASSGALVVSVGPRMNDSNAVTFAVTSQPLPIGWLDQDIGQVGVAGSATYTNGTFTITGGGIAFTSLPDELHFVYQPLSGDGTVIARVVSLQGGTSPEAGVTIRETLNPSATDASVFCATSAHLDSEERTTTGGSANFQEWGNGAITLPYWFKAVRSGSTFTFYGSPDGVSWVQAGASQTISMAQNVYIGLGAGSSTTSALTTATFDGVSVSTSSVPAATITSVSATTGTIGSQVTITGTGFGASEGSSSVFLNSAPMTINTWSNTSIIATIPTGATSGLLVVSVAPSMNESNGVAFTVTSQPLPLGWLDRDIGPVGLAGSATFTGTTFTVNGAGLGDLGPPDALHFVYQPLSGDGSIVARVVSLQGGSSPQAGVMIRETFDPAATNVYSYLFRPTNLEVADRTSSGAAASNAFFSTVTLPYWVKAVRSGSTFAEYSSPDGVTWTQLGTSQTISMAQNVYIGLGVASFSTSVLSTATFDNGAVIIGTTPFVTAITPVLGGIGTSVTITGSNFGASQGSSTVRFNGTAATTITSWSNTQIVATVPTGATTGPVSVTVNSISSVANPAYTVIHPVINSLVPPSSPVGGTVDVVGSGFGAGQGSNTVQLNGTSLQIVSWSDALIKVAIPSSVTNSGPITVVEDSVASNGAQFTLLGQTAITGISPSVGPVGTAVTITGTGFGASQSDTALTFDGVTATATSWNNTQIVANVPTGAATGPVTVQVADVTTVGPVFSVNATRLLTDSLGHQTTYTSAIAGGVWALTNSQGSGCSSCTLRGTIQNQYDSHGRVLSTTDALGNVTTYTYDANGNVASASAQLGGGVNATTSYTYNSLGEVLTLTDALGHVTTITYDASGNLLSVTSPAPDGNTAASVTQFAYNSQGELTQITDPLNHVTTLTYTTAGLIATIKDAQNNVTTYGYDAHGNRTSVTDALSHQTTFAYDTGDRLTTITYPGSTTTIFTYDSRGRRTSVKDQNGKTTTYTYDDADRLTTVKDAANNTTTYNYDTENNLTSILDANGHSTAFTYDAFGRVTATNFPSTLTETYAYDANNNLTSKTDRKGHSITYVYDALNRLTKKHYPDSTEVDYVYDLVGKIQSVNDPTGTYPFAYDNMGRLIGTTTSYSFLTGRNFTTSYSYDKASNRTGFTDPESGSTAYVYDTLNRLTTLTPPSAFTTGSFGFSYDALGRRTQLTRPNNVASNYTYDNLSRLSSVLHQLSGSTIDGATYTVDNAGNRTAKTDQRAVVTSNYAYDAIYELTGVTQGTNTTESYTYDPVGNRLSSLGVSSYTNNVSNELTAKTGVTYTYDNNGNTLTSVTGSNTTTYAWDFENRLTSVTLPGTNGTVTFKYDPFGRRIYKSSSSGTSVYAYDDDRLVEEANAAGGVVARYSQGLNIDEPLAMLRSSTTDYYDADGLGTITSLSNAAGALAQTYTFDSFGKQTALSGSLVNALKFTAREFDTETNLYFYRARYYDPSVGRFLSEDPTRFQAGVDFYPYVGNSPSNFADPMGLCPQNDPCWTPLYPPGQNVDKNIFSSVTGGPLFWFFMQNLPHAPWDYNKLGYQYDAAGNFNYGATGTAIGIPSGVLLTGADAYKDFMNFLRNKPMNGNEPEKNDIIQKGIDYVKNGCFSLFSLFLP